MKTFVQVILSLVSIVLAILVLTGDISGVVLAIWVLSTWAFIIVLLLIVGALYVIGNGD